MSTATEGAARTAALERLRMMLLIRRFEEASLQLYTQGKIRGFLHLYVGQEAIATGAFRALTPEDSVVSNYREHGHALARGMAPGVVMAEMFGKLEGCSRGRGGSMHLFDVSRRFYGGNAIVGGGFPLAAGIALADAMRGRAAVTACLFGDGAVIEGVFHETANLAALWKLPVLFLCENNRYAMGTAIERGQAQTDLALKARAHGVPAATVDGMDVIAVEDAVREAASAVRAGGGPRFLELQTYRFRAHSMYDPERYRERAEVEQWKTRDPIDRFERAMRATGALEAPDRARLEGEVDAEIRAAVAFAEAGTWESVEDLTRFVGAERRSP